MSERSCKTKVLALLQSPDQKTALTELRSMPGRELVHGLFSGICRADETIRWRAITAMGVVVPKIADEDMEAARVIMRRLMWSLNDESGGIGWGAPEAMAEILGQHEQLALEYAHILVSYMREDSNFLEHNTLQRGLMWAIGRAARTWTTLFITLKAQIYLLPYLQSDDPEVVGLAAWAAGAFPDRQLAAALNGLTDDQRQVRCFIDNRIQGTTIGALAGDSIRTINLALTAGSH